MKKILFWIYIIVACIICSGLLKNLVQDSSPDEGLIYELFQDLCIDEDSSDDVSSQKAENDIYIAPEFQGKTGYYYTFLNEEEQQLYGELVTAYLNYEEVFDLSVNYSNMDSDAIHTVHWYVLLDYPEIFWLNGENSISYIEADEGKILQSINVTNQYTVEEIENYNSQLDLVVKEVETLVEAVTSDYERALAIYEYIILNCEYNQEAAEVKITSSTETEESLRSSSIIGTLIDGEAICSGYSESYTYLLTKIGINCFSVLGDADNVGHQWNIIMLDGAYYQVDCTWGDADSEQKEADDISYNYFGLTSEQIWRTHIEMNDIIYPVCTATEYNYYVYNGWCYDTYEYAVIMNQFEVAINDNKEEVSFCFTTEEAYENAKSSLVDKDLSKIITTYNFKLSDGCSYLMVDELYLITVRLNYKY